MRAVHVDTHVLVWLAEANQTRLAPLQRHLEGQRLVASPIAVLELQYLYEIGRIRRSDEAILDNLGTTLGLDGLGGDSETLALAKTAHHFRRGHLAVSESPWACVVGLARAQTWTRDPFDRLIVAHALADGCLLATADQKILAHCREAVVS